VVAWHCERNEFYGKLLKKHGIKPDAIEKEDDLTVVSRVLSKNFI
jgi:phenylacetate-coenzyme A ligase PaaK-like adenylate-forming protein